MQTFSLFEDGELTFFESTPKPVEIALVETVAAKPELPRYSERRDLAARITLPNTVVLHKIKSKAVRVIPTDLESFYTLTVYKQFKIQTSLPHLPPNLEYNSAAQAAVPAIEKMGDPKSPDLYFRLDSAIGATLQDSTLYKHLTGLGMNVVAAPSLENWIPRAWRRRQREDTPFLLPDIPDTRPVYDRIEEGTIIKCVHDYPPSFKANSKYIVGQKTVTDEDANILGSIRLHEYYGNGRCNTLPTEWPETRSMEGYFEPEQAQEVIYEPSKCVPTVYKKEFEANLARIDKEGWEVYDHTRFDAAQAAVMRSYFNGKLMRMGKAQPLDAGLLTPEGWKSMGDIHIGDSVYGSDGTPQHVTAIYPQGHKDVYRVRFNDGSSTECCDEHLWQVTLPWRKHEDNVPQILSLAEIADRLVDGAGNLRFYIPLVEPIEFPEKKLPLDPYALGLLLGDGHLARHASGYGTPAFSSADPELVEALNAALPAGLKARKTGKYDYAITNPSGRAGRPRNELAVILEDLDLRHRSEGKFVPEMYKQGSISQRRKLLSGLLDTDGSCYNISNKTSASIIEYCSTSEKLADDVVFLVQSLGGTATKTNRITQYTHKGEKRNGRLSYRVRISFGPGWNPFTLRRKAEKYRPCTKFLPGRGIVAVEPVGIKPCQCITVEAENGLYVTDNFILTHNTREAIVFQRLRNNKKVVFFGPKNGSPFVLREAKALKLDHECKIVDDHRKLSSAKDQPWMEIVPYGWIKYKKDPGSEIDPVRPCPHCNQPLERKAWIQETKKNPNVYYPNGFVPTPAHWEWTNTFGYLCRNTDCTYTQTFQTKKGQPLGGAAWLDTVQTIVHHTEKGSGYVDLNRKILAKLADACGDKVDAKESEIKGRQRNGQYTICKKAGSFTANPKHIKIQASYVQNTWIPPRYRRLKHRWKHGIFDEIHAIAAESKISDVNVAAMSLHLKTASGLTGTLMPNGPSGAFWPLMRMFGNETHRFPYPKKHKTNRGEYTGLYAGKGLFNNDFTNTITIISNEKDGKGYEKRLPYMKNPVKFWRLMAPKMIRRTYDDPLVLSSLEKAGLKVPKANHQIVLAEPDLQQAALMYASMEDFRQRFQEYQNSLVAHGISNDKTYQLNSSIVISQMTRMKMGATCPDYINEKLKAINPDAPPLYTGAPGGGKMEPIYNIVVNKTLKGEKVLILSNFKAMQRTLAKELSKFKPIVFDTSWNTAKRLEAFDLFNEDPMFQVFIAGPLAIAESVDLAGGPDSKCRTVISTDLLWSPGKQLQAWSRIMKPAKEEFEVDIFTTLLNHSIDQHIHNVFYSKIVAAEQALDRKVITQKEKTFDVLGFTEQVLADRVAMLAILEAAAAEEVSYLPMLDLFQTMEDRE